MNMTVPTTWEEATATSSDVRQAQPLRAATKAT
jgi:hypothetical protein